MKIEQKIVVVYTLFGILLGILTNNFSSTFNLITAIGIPFVLYFTTLPILFRVVKNKKTTLFYNSFVTFILVWLTVWILLYNLGG